MTDATFETLPFAAQAMTIAATAVLVTYIIVLICMAMAKEEPICTDEEDHLGI